MPAYQELDTEVALLKWRKWLAVLYKYHGPLHGGSGGMVPGLVDASRCSCGKGNQLMDRQARCSFAASMSLTNCRTVSASAFIVPTRIFDVCVLVTYLQIKLIYIPLLTFLKPYAECKGP